MSLLLAAALAACSKADPQPKAAAAKPAALEQTPAPAPAPPPAAEAAPGAERDRSKPNTFAQESDFLKPGWSKLSMHDTLPLCIFSSTFEREKAPFMKDVKKVTLKGKATFTFGVYGPWCLHEGCDVRPNLQCWTKVEGNTINVFTRYSSFHHDVQSCSQDCLGPDSSCEASECMSLDTSCTTPELPPGKYTIRHGEKSYELKIPSVQKQPCLK